MSLYYEVHVSCEWPTPLDDQSEVVVWVYLCGIRDWAKGHGWHMGDLLMMKSEDERSRKDLFFTTRTETMGEAVAATREFIDRVRGHGFTLTRYKIEDTVLDSRINDEFEAL